MPCDITYDPLFLYQKLVRKGQVALTCHSNNFKRRVQDGEMTLTT